MLLSVYWFHPVLWMAYALLCRDIEKEKACDEKAVRNMDTQDRKGYSHALVSCSMHHSTITACPLAFGEVGVKNRVKSVLHYKKPALWIIAAAVLACAGIILGFLTVPRAEPASAIRVLDSGSQMEGLLVEIKDYDLSSPSPYIEIQWNNSTQQEFVYGEAFYIYQSAFNEWKDCRPGDAYAWNAIGYTLQPQGTSAKKYYLGDLEMQRPGTYRLETSCSGAHDRQEYAVWISFTLQGGVETVMDHTFAPAELIYSSSGGGEVSGLAYRYRILKGMQLEEITKEGRIEAHGHMEEDWLFQDTFDNRFTYISFWAEGYSMASMKAQNKRIWKLYKEDSNNYDHGELYILLQQSDGTFYLGYGTYDFQRDADLSFHSQIHWLYRLESVII